MGGLELLGGKLRLLVGHAYSREVVGKPSDHAFENEGHRGVGGDVW